MDQDEEIESTRTTTTPYQARLPGFISDETVGLGDAINRVTYFLGIKPCGGCEHRTALLNRWVVFTGRTK